MWCDVAPLGVCHIFICCTWQYDQKTTHNGEKNTYMFIKDGRQVMLVLMKKPLRPPSSVRSSSTTAPKAIKAKAKTSSVLLTQLLFEDEIRSYQCVVFLVVKKAGDSLSVPRAILSLLEKYKEIILDELSDNLPLLRNIQHYIDLVIEATLPHLPHYRMSP